MGGPEKWQFSLTLCCKKILVGGWVVQERLKTPLRNIKMAPNDISLGPVTHCRLWSLGDHREHIQFTELHYVG